MKFVYFERDHSYYVDGERLSGVTEVLGKQGLVRDHTYTDPYYRDRGSAVHSAIKLDILGRLSPQTREMADYMPMVNRALRVVMDLQIEPKLLEQPLFDPVYRYAGQPDLGGFSQARNRVVLLDFKTGGFEPGYQLQLQGAYSPLVKIAAEKGQIDIDPEEYWRADLFVVLLAQDPPKLVPLDPSERSLSMSVFRQALAVYNWRRRNKLV